MDFETTKLQMVRAYSRRAEQYGRSRNPAFDAFLYQELEFFSRAVKAGGRSVLDVGSGPGNESLLLQEYGLVPICVDFSMGMARECLAKQLSVCVADFYHLCFHDEIFYGIWMAFSLLHAPKSTTPQILSELHRVLKPGGTVYISLFEGEGEGLRKQDVKQYGCQRYFAYYQQEELANLVSRQFAITRTARLDISPRPTVSIQARRE